MGLPIFQVDAFTEEPFRGNPAAVCLLDRPAEAEWMQEVAREMNLSETAFVAGADDGFHLRWFTPTTEVDLCGHATLASAHVLWETGRAAASSSIRFHTRSGLLTAVKAANPGGLIEMDFPKEESEPAEPPAELVRALGLGARPFDKLRAGRAAIQVAKNRFDYLVELETEQAVRDLRPDLALMARVPARGVMVTAVCESGAADFVSRFFGPAVGVPEDPVTGSAHCCLGPYWGARLGKQDLTGYQASARGGTVRVRLDGGRVWLGGRAVTVLRGELTPKTRR